jgi:ParB family transcriptional regulator, chromosome partitioning protein
MLKIEEEFVDAIEVYPGRDIDPRVVETLAASMDRVGQLCPILLRKPLVENCPAILISGRHRLEAAKLLGWKFIQACYLRVSGSEARMREISENLHRNELTVLERAKQIEEWRILCEQAPSVQLVHSGGTPQRGVTRAAKELGVSRPEVKRAEKIAKITPEAQEAAKSAGIDNNQSKLLEIAKTAPEQQSAKVALVTAKRKGKVKVDVPTAPDERDEFNIPHNCKSLPKVTRLNGFKYRAEEAARGAAADDLSGLKITEDLRLAASRASAAWDQLCLELHGGAAPVKAAKVEVVPTKAEADESYQQTLYEQAYLILESMTEETREAFFGDLKGEYNVCIKWIGPKRDGERPIEIEYG